MIGRITLAALAFSNLYKGLSSSQPKPAEEDSGIELTPEEREILEQEQREETGVVEGEEAAGAQEYEYKTETRGQWQNFPKIVGPAVDRLRSIGSPNKPIAIFEFGCDDEGQRINDQKIYSKAAWLTEAYAWMVKKGIRLSVYFNQNKLEKEGEDYTFRFWALNSDDAKLAFRDSTQTQDPDQPDPFVNTLHPVIDTRSEQEQILSFLERLLGKWDFDQEAEDFIGTPDYNRSEYDLRRKIYGQILKSIKHMQDESEVVLQPERYVGSPRLQRVSQSLLQLANALTALEKYREAILVYSLVPKHSSVFAFRRMAVIGEANAITFRDYEGDASRSIGLFNYARHLLDDNWGSYDLPGKVHPGFIFPGVAGSLWLEDTLATAPEVEELMELERLAGYEEELTADATIKRRKKHLLPLPDTMAHASWKYADDMLLMAMVQAGLGARYSYLADWPEARKRSLPHLKEALRIWHTVGKRPYRMLPIEPTVWLTIGQLWAIYKDEVFGMDKNLNLGEDEHDPMNLCDRIREYKPYFEERGDFERWWTEKRGKEEELHYPIYLVAGADLVEADLRSRTENVNQLKSASEICGRVLQNSPVLSQRARAYYLQARIALKFEDRIKAQQLCEKARKMLKGKPELDATKIGIRILLATITGNNGFVQKAVDKFEKIEKLLKTYPQDNYLKREVRMQLSKFREMRGGSENLRRIQKGFVKTLKRMIQKEVTEHYLNISDEILAVLPDKNTLGELCSILLEYGISLDHSDEFKLIRKWAKKNMLWCE